MNSIDQHIIVGISGGTGSGKTSVALEICNRLGNHITTYLSQDNYYRDQRHLPSLERDRLNFDHPNTIETELLANHLRRLKAGETVSIPVYDFSTHTRMETGIEISPKQVVILEGLFVLCEPLIRKTLDLKFFLDEAPDVRFIRRLKRDLDERGRNLESVVDQYLHTVRPMYLQFIHPSKQYADLVITGGTSIQTIATEILFSIKSLRSKKQRLGFPVEGRIL
ncbi:MAG: uridine kinase [Candidatus Hodarchaeota archaeon]